MKKKKMKIKFNSDEFSLKKALQLYNIIVFVRSVLNASNKYIPQVFLDDYLFKLAGQHINVGV